MPLRYNAYFARDVDECAERVAKDAMTRTCPPRSQTSRSDFQDELAASGYRHEGRVVARLAAMSGVRVVSGFSPGGARDAW